MAASCAADTGGAAVVGGTSMEGQTMDRTGLESLVLGGGCFWCLEAAYELVPGVKDVESGYAGGSRENPSYEQVSTGLTGHAEVVRVWFDPGEVDLGRLFELFWKVHDPTTEDRQGADVGTQYRSIILYQGDAQKTAAELAVRQASATFRDPIVTDVEPLGVFWPAEDYHQDFYRKNPEYGYCRVVVAPKVDKTKAFIGDMNR
ncbi:MAG: peptide-methionine (S)-S-oxide reductase MsrA [Spirochaetia bacterium]|nr:peptide-methionine (S)-S-oxide reductase MsrA [Spirochaetia bacterium]